MRVVTNRLAERARSIFADIGYSVSREGAELRAERKWRVVRITPTDDASSLPSNGEYRCFVTPPEVAPDLRGELAATDPDYEWAVLAVDEDGDYEVLREPAS